MNNSWACTHNLNVTGFGSAFVILIVCMSNCPRWEAKQFPKNPVKDKLNLLVSGFGKNYKEGTLGIYQDAYIYGGKINKGDQIIYNIKHQAYLLCSYGSVTLDDKVLEKGDQISCLII